MKQNTNNDVCWRKQSLVVALILTPQLDERSCSVQSNRPMLTLRHVGHHPTFKSHMWLWETPRIIDLGWWCWSAGAACRIWSHWSGIVTRSWISIRPCVSSVPYHPRNKGLLCRRPDITSDHSHIPSLKNLSHEFLYFLVWMEERVAAGVWPDNIILKLSYQRRISTSMPQKEEIGHFQSTPPLWVSRLQVITVNCWICWRGEHYNHVSPDKAVLKQTKSYPHPHFSSPPQGLLIELISMQMHRF